MLKSSYQTKTCSVFSASIDSLHKKKHRSSITFLRCYNHAVTLICILVPLLLVWHVNRNSLPSSVIHTIELRTSSSNTGRRPQTYSNTIGSLTHKRGSLFSKTHLKLIFLIFFSLSCYLKIFPFYTIYISLHILFFFHKIEDQDQFFSSCSRSGLTKEGIKFHQ